MAAMESYAQSVVLSSVGPPRVCAGALEAKATGLVADVAAGSMAKGVRLIVTTAIESQLVENDIAICFCILLVGSDFNYCCMFTSMESQYWQSSFNSFDVCSTL